MIKLLLALMLSIVPILASDIELEMNVKPHYEALYTARVTTAEEWRTTRPSFRINQIFKKFDDLYESIGFQRCGIFHGEYDRANFFYGRFDSSGRLLQGLVNDLQYHGRSLSPHFTYQTCDRPWISKTSAIQMSWDWIEHSYKDCLERNLIYTDSDKHFKKRIETKGLSRSLIRIAIVINGNGYCSFNAIFDTEEERQKSKKVLVKLKDHVISTCEDFASFEPF